jgi:hypothetical protein
MDLNWFVDSVPGLACLAIDNGLADCESHAPVCLDLWADLYVDISAFCPIELQGYATGVSSLSWDSCRKSQFFS